VVSHCRFILSNLGFLADYLFYYPFCMNNVPLLLLSPVKSPADERETNLAPLKGTATLAKNETVADGRKSSKLTVRNLPDQIYRKTGRWFYVIYSSVSL
jgi:hypothetical protein